MDCGMALKWAVKAAAYSLGGASGQWIGYASVLHAGKMSTRSKH
jgi:hypothetical protein